MLACIGLLHSWLPASAQKSGDDATALPTLPTVLPPSPTAASLGRFGEIPVGLYTGIPTISIPLYTAHNAGGPAAVSIALAYHASGIRVNDLGSWVGLGWALECGGVVTRTVHGLPDEDGNGYWHRGGQYLTSYLKGQFNSQVPPAYDLREQASQEKIDFEPDVFSFNFGGYAGQFVVDTLGQSVLLPQQNLLVKVRPDFSGFNITTEDGTIYQFTHPESSTSNTVPNRREPEIYPSSWYLDSIQPVSGPAITFVYSAPTLITYPASNSESKQITVDFLSTSPSESNKDVRLGQVKSTFSRTDVVTSTITLQQIRLAAQTINFFASDRGDVAGAVKLDSLEVLDQTGVRAKFYSFQYTTGASNRVYLNQVQEGQGSNKAPPYQFTYNYGLPPVYAYQQDHWGFYNRNSAATLVPTDTLLIGSQSNVPAQINRTM